MLATILYAGVAEIPLAIDVSAGHVLRTAATLVSDCVTAAGSTVGLHGLSSIQAHAGATMRTVANRNTIIGVESVKGELRLY